MAALPLQFGIGQPVRRVEDPRLLRGQGRYADDLAPTGALVAAFVRSPHPHAEIVRLDASGALAVRGVVAVITGDDLRRAGRGALPCTLTVAQDDGTPARLPPRLALPHDRARFVGEAVAMVVAETIAAARDGAEAVAIEWHALDPVIGIDRARNGASLHESVPGNRAYRWQAGDADAVDRAFRGATHRVTRRVRVNRVTAAPLETRGAIATWDGALGRFTLVVATQGTTEAHGELSAHGLGGVAARALRILTPDVGGGFGMKNHAYPEHVALLHAAQLLDRPIRWQADRTESFVSDSAGRDHEITVSLALDAEARIEAVRWEWLSDLGAYGAGFGPAVGTLGGPRIAVGPYAIPSFHIVSEGYLTTTAPIDAYRGAGKPEAAYALESVIDAAAAELGLDPATLRRRNLVPASAMPYRTATGQVYDSGDFPRVMERALALADRPGFLARRAASQASGRLRGFGFAIYVEPSGFRDGRTQIALDRTGGAMVITSAVSNGQPHETVFAQVVHERLGIPFDRIRVVQGDSDVTGFGSGTAGSRSLTLAGVGVHRCAVAIEAKGRRIAANLLEASEADVVAERGVFRIAGTDRSVTLAEVAAAAWNPALVPEDESLGLEAAAHPVQRVANFPNGCHVAEVEIDRATGAVVLQRYAAVNDFGVVVNPLTLGGQVTGGIVQGIGQILFEDMAYDPETGQTMTASFMDYALPRADDLPDFLWETVEIPCATNPLGVKGCGEAGCAGSLPAVMNAVSDALRSAGVPSRHLPLPMPVTAERVWRALAASS